MKGTRPLDNDEIRPVSLLITIRTQSRQDSTITYNVDLQRFEVGVMTQIKFNRGYMMLFSEEIR